ncbi:T9SS type A sorting domain-containing protein [bacterium]|nr:T9SS type A sorting domain-containing protein [bacterium]
MKKKIFIFKIIFALNVPLAIFCPDAGSETLYVPGAYPTIQAAINAASGGDKVLVAAGTYYENIIMKTRVQISGAGQNVTIIDGGGKGPVVTAKGVEAAGLEGFSCINGLATLGGGMFNLNASPVVTNCVFSSNTADFGGGMYNDNSSPLATNCIFSNNSANSIGRIIYNTGLSNPIMINCTFIDKTSSGDSNHNGITSNPPSLIKTINCILDLHSPAEIYNNGYSSPVALNSNTEDDFTGKGNIQLTSFFASPGRKTVAGAGEVFSLSQVAFYAKLQNIPIVEAVDLRLTNAEGLSSYPTLAPAAQGFAMAYDDDRANPGSLFYNDRQIFFATYNLDGISTGVEVAVTDLAVGSAVRPDMVRAGSNYALVYEREGESGTSGIFFDLLTETGMHLLPEPVAVTLGYFHNPSLTWTGNGFGITFSGRVAVEDDPHVWFAALDANGQLQGNIIPVSGITDSSYNKFPKIAFAGGRFGIAWQDRRNGFWEIFFRKMSINGTAASNELRVTTAQNSLSSAVQILFNGSEFALAYSDTRNSQQQYQVYLARIAADGSRVLAEYKVSQSSGNADTPQLAFFNEAYCVVWVEKVDGDPGMFSLAPNSPCIDAGADLGLPFNGAAPDIGAVEFGNAPFQPEGASEIHMALVSPEVGPGTPILLSSNSGFSAFPVIEPVEDKVVVCWFDSRDGGREIYGALLNNPAGNINYIPDPESATSIKVYPNPAQDRVTFSFESFMAGPTEIRIFNIAGRMVSKISGSITSSERELEWDARRTPTGVYLYQVYQNGRAGKQGKIVLQK